MKFSLLSTAEAPALWSEVCAHDLSMNMLGVVLIQAADVAAVISGARGRRVTRRAAVYVYESLVDVLSRVDVYESLVDVLGRVDGYTSVAFDIGRPT